MDNLRINTDTILANLFAYSNNNSSYSLKQITNFFDTLRAQIPYYIMTNFGIGAIHSCIRRYPTLYKVEHNDESEEIVVYAGDYKPNLDYFNYKYSKKDRRSIETIAKFYVDRLSGK